MTYHPLTAVNPELQQVTLPTFLQHLLFPDVTSVNVALAKVFFPRVELYPTAYRVGFTKPIAAFPSASLALFTKEIKAAKTGADAEVPYTLYVDPSIIT